MFAVTYLSYKYYILKTTNVVPYKNLTEIGSSSCYVYFNIEYRDKTYPVVLTNALSNSFVNMKSGFLRSIYPFYLNEIISRDASIGVDSTLFANIEFAIVPDSTLMRLQTENIVGEPRYVNGFRLSDSLDQFEQNAVIYMLLKHGYNCCVQDESGRIMIANP